MSKNGIETLTEDCETAFAPMPVLGNGKGKLYKNSTAKEWFAKIQEEVFEAHEAAAKSFCASEAYKEFYKNELAEELTDIKTVCESYLHALGYDAKARAEIQRKVNAKNAARGYLDDVENADADTGEKGSSNT